MAGYKCVNFVDLCRLCAGSGIGGKTGIFSEEGKRKNMLTRINSTLTLKVNVTIIIQFIKNNLNVSPRFTKRTACQRASAHAAFASWKLTSSSGRRSSGPRKCCRAVSTQPS